MSAAATAAGYLYASGRLRGKASREAEPEQPKEADKPKRRPLRVAVYAPQPAEYEQPRERPVAKKAPKIEYRTRRWRPA
jgi:hypothetical protein